MRLHPMTMACYAVAKADYARYQAGEELEFEQEMDAFLPAKLLLCQLDEAFQKFQADITAIGTTFSPEDEDLAELIGSAISEIEASRQAFIGGYVRDEQA